MSIDRLWGSNFWRVRRVAGDCRGYAYTEIDIPLLTLQVLHQGLYQSLSLFLSLLGRPLGLFLQWLNFPHPGQHLSALRLAYLCLPGSWALLLGFPGISLHHGPNVSCVFPCLVQSLRDILFHRLLYILYLEYFYNVGWFPSFSDVIPACILCSQNTGQSWKMWSNPSEDWLSSIWLTSVITRELVFPSWHKPLLSSF